MTEQDDTTLLLAWVQHASQAAFGALARRYAGLLYHAALRTTGRADLAEEAAQNALAIFARKAARVSPEPSLAPWLHRTACYEAAKLLRRERRHHDRMNALPPPDDAPDSDPWQHAASLLDAALDALPAADRRVLLLKYFDGWSFEQMAARLGGQAAAWRQRGSRAVERLRRIFARRGHTLSAAALTAGLGAAFSATAPPAVAATLATAPLQAAAGLTAKSLLLHSLHLMNIKPIATAVVVALAALIPLGLQYQSVAAARCRVDELEISVRSQREAMSTHESAASAAAATARLKAKPAAPDRTPVDLAAWADVIASSRTGGVPFSAMLAIERALEDMDADTLEQLCMDATRLDIAPEKRHLLIEHLLSQMFDKDKGGRRIVELTGAICRQLGDERTLDLWNQCSSALSQWAGRDPSAARAWFEQSESSGLFDGKSLHHRDFLIQQIRGNLFAGLYSGDRAAALTLLNSLDAPGKTSAISTLSVRHKEAADLLALAATLRPEMKRQALAHHARSLAGDDLEAAAAFVQSAQLTGRDHRELMIDAATGHMQPLTAEQYNERVAWLRRGVPDDADKAVGYFLGARTTVDAPGARRALNAALAAGPNDELTGAYARRWAQMRPEILPEALQLAAGITDPEIRARTLSETIRWRTDAEARAAAEKAAFTAQEIETALQNRQPSTP